jgi:hypothetical protein
MALILPLLLMVLFGIIDLGYYIYGYATIYFAARNGTEVAAELPPYPNKINDGTDRCTAAILTATQKGMVLLPNFSTNLVTLRYPTNTRALGEPIEVRIKYDIQPLTPLFRLVRFGNNGVMSVDIAARRSIEILGNGPVSSQNPDGIVCDP